MAMDFFRRPALVGKGPLGRLTSGRVRGSVRRSDPDGTSAVPYFPLVSIGQQLTFVTQGGSGTATLTGVSLTQVIADIQSALGANAKAEIDDGSIAIETGITGSAGFIRITGGNASSGLGFETYGGTRVIESRGSDIASAPEARVGNPFGAAFMEKIENLTTESVSRGMGRMAANADVLWSDHVKNDFKSKQVSFSVGTAGAYITPTAAQRLLTGTSTVGGLTRNSLKTDLIGHYQLVDPVTGLAAPSQVVAVVRGTPVGDPPYADAPSWSDSTGKSVLGLDLAKVTAATIVAITEGRYIQCSGVTFVTTGVLAGDYLEIASATNLTPFSNIGYRWVIEQVLSESVVAVRPMSSSELTSVSTSVVDVQPLVELNDTKGSLEVFGTCTIRTGPSQHNVNLVVRPPIPTNSTYQLRASVPSSIRDNEGIEDQFSQQAAFKELASPYATVHDGMISGCNVSNSGGNVLVATGIARWNGRAISIPATTFLVGSLTNGADNYVYWDETTAALGHSNAGFNATGVEDPGSVSGRGHLLAIVTVSGGVIVSIFNCKRTIADWSRPIAVGQGGQFTNLDQALAYFNVFVKWNSETATAVGDYRHYEIILINDCQYSGTSIQIPNLTIRGSSPAVKLSITLPLLLQLTAGGSLNIKDLQIETLIPVESLVKSTIGSSSVRISNVRFVTTSTLDYVVHFTAPAAITYLSIDNDCHFTTTTGIVRGSSVGGVTSRMNISNSDFDTDGSVATPLLFSDDGATTCGIDTVSITSCKFFGEWITNSPNDPLCISHTGRFLSMRDVYFDLGRHDSADNNFLVGAGGDALIDNVIVGSGNIPILVAGSATTTVSNCRALVNPEATKACITAHTVYNNYLEHQDTGGNVVGGYGIVGSGTGAFIYNNDLFGPYNRAIFGTVDEVQILGNRINLSFIANASPFTGIYLNGLTRPVVDGNTITHATGSFSGIMIDAGSSFEAVIANNRIHMKNPVAASVQHLFIQLLNANYPRVTGNGFKSTGTWVFGASQSMIGVQLNGSQFAEFTGNVMQLAANGAAVWNAITLSGNIYTNISSNVVQCYGSPIATVGNIDLTNVIDGNTFHAVGAPASTGRLFGTVSNNNFTADGPTFHEALIGCGVFTGNQFDRVTFTIGGETASTIIFTGNIVANSTVGNSLGLNASGHGAIDITVADNWIGGDAIIETSGGDVKVTNNFFGGALTISACLHTSVQDNVITGNFSIPSLTSGSARVSISSNTFSGDFDVNQSINAWSLYVGYNRFIATTIGTWNAHGRDSFIVGNSITPVNGVAVSAGGVNCIFESNFVFATVGSTASNIATSVTAGGGNSSQVSKNTVYGKLFVSQTNERLGVHNNNVFYVGADHGLTVDIVGQNASITGNRVLIEGGSSGATDWNYSPLLVNGQAGHIAISDNHLTIANYGVTYTGDQTLYIIQLVGFSDLMKVTVTGNLLDKLDSATISAHTIGSSYVKETNNQFSTFSNNLMFTSGVIGPAGVWRGDYYSAGAGTVTIDATTHTP